MITPNVALLRAEPGAANVGEFVRLKNSDRNCSRYLSLIVKFLMIDMSVLRTPSAETLGNVREAFPSVYARGCEKAAV